MRSDAGSAAGGWALKQPIGLNATRLRWVESQRLLLATSRLHRSNFRPTDRRTGFLMPPSAEDWVPQHHSPRFVAEVVDGVGLWAMSGAHTAAHVRRPTTRRFC